MGEEIGDFYLRGAENSTAAKTHYIQASPPSYL